MAAAGGVAAAQLAASASRARARSTPAPGAREPVGEEILTLSPTTEASAALTPIGIKPHRPVLAAGPGLSDSEGKLHCTLGAGDRGEPVGAENTEYPRWQ